MIGLNDIIRATVYTVLGGTGEGINVFTFLVAALGSADDNDIIDTLEAHFQTIYGEIQARMADTTVVRDFTLERYLPLLDDWVRVGSGTIGLLGTNVTELLPQQATGSSTARTARGRTRGRKSWPGLSEVTQNGGFLSAGTVADIAAATAWWMLGAEDVALGLLLQAGVQATGDKSFVPFTGSGLVKNVMGTLTTRKAGRGL